MLHFNKLQYFSTLILTMYRILPLIIFVALTATGRAQVKPGEGDILNYRLAGFSVPAVANTEKYIFEVSEYTSTGTEEIFTNTIIQTSDSNKTIIMLPAFNKAYAWRVTYQNAKGKKGKPSPYHYFKTGNSIFIDTAKYRLHIVDSAKHHDEIYVILDYIPVIYDLKGSPIWYMPSTPTFKYEGFQLRDIKANKDGTFTGTANEEAFCIDYNGKIIWEGPNDGKVSGDTSEFYHHELTKLSNGNYMVASHQYTMRKIPPNVKIDKEKYLDVTTDPTAEQSTFQKRKDGYYRRLTLSNIIEYNSKGEVVWYWKSIDHFNDKDFFVHRSQGMLTDMHMNSFFFDEDKKAIYISFRNINEIIKISYPSGKILKRYGAIWEKDSLVENERLFVGQHCVQVSPSGEVYLFNNNTTGRLRGNNGALEDTSVNIPPVKLISYVEKYKETNSKTGLEPIWKFSCDIDTFTEGGTGVGGSVIMMDDGCILTCVGGAGRVFIVSPEKKVIWNAVPQIYQNASGWFTTGQYRAFYIKKKDLEKFIFKE